MHVYIYSGTCLQLRIRKLLCLVELKKGRRDRKMSLLAVKEMSMGTWNLGCTKMDFLPVRLFSGIGRPMTLNIVQFTMLQLVRIFRWTIYWLFWSYTFNLHENLVIYDIWLYTRNGVDCTGLWHSSLFIQAGDIAFSVPNSLVVTLERVLGNETVGKVLWWFWLFLFTFFFFFFSPCAWDILL